MKLLTSEEVQHLLLFIQEKKNPILRDIKAAFPNNDKLVDIIEKLIQYHLIQRKDRRYYCTLEEISIEKWEQALDKTSVFVKEKIKEIQSIADNTLEYHFLIMNHCQLLQSQWFPNYPLIFKSDLPLTMIHSFHSNRELWLEVGTWDNSQLTLLDYFADCQSFPILATHQPLFKLIGDVNPQFFLHHCATKLRRAQRRGKLEEEYNIFNDALEQYGYLNNGRVTFPVLNKKEGNTLIDKVSSIEKTVFSIEKGANFSFIEQQAILHQLILQLSDEGQKIIISK